jgi:ATP-dependent DNA helicase RecG
MKDVETPIQYLKTIGPKRAEMFEKIGIKTVKDLLFYFPTQYLDRSKILSSDEAYFYVANGYENEITIVGQVAKKEIINSYRKKLLKVTFRDLKGFFDGVWFNGIKFFQNKFNEGDYFAISAKPAITRYGHLQFVHPEFDKLDTSESDEFLNTGKLIPFYRFPKALKSKNIGEFSFRKLIKNTVELFSDSLTETLPEDLVAQRNLLSLSEAVTTIHLPDDKLKLKKAWARVKFEEFFFFELLVALKKSFVKNDIKGISIKVNPDPIKKFLDSLPFELTDDQLSVLHEIRLDMESPKPMNRLLQGDVGSGKTIVALISMLMAVFSGYQTVLMAPTEILANQHFENLTKLTKQFGLMTTVVLGSQKPKERETIRNLIQSGDADIIIGTHALFQEKIKFKNLGLVVIDEQHRFGVEQRFKLINKGISPDVLIMTATPIPRTLSLTLYGDLDVSTISNSPASRKEVKTYLSNESKLDEIYSFVREKIDKEGYQVFIVYPLVEKSEKLEFKSAIEHYEKLKEGFLEDYRVGLIHGKMKWDEKEEMMRRFLEKDFDVLVATTVIEVGIDIPNANIIIINDANRFGLSQLHQLRGRVGRSDKQAYCILVTKEDYKHKVTSEKFSFEFMSKAEIEKNKTAIRLNALAQYSDGFKLSEIDLKLRGPGDIFGTRQSGLPELKYGNIVEDADLLFSAKDTAFKVISSDPKLSRPENGLLNKYIKKNFASHFKYLKIG